MVVLTLEGLPGGGLLDEQPPDESTVGGDTGTGGNHDEISLGGGLGHQHDLSGGAGQSDLVTYTHKNTQTSTHMNISTKIPFSYKELFIVPFMHRIYTNSSDRELKPTRLGVAEEVGANTLLGGVLLSGLGVNVNSAADAERSGLALKVITVPLELENAVEA